MNKIDHNIEEYLAEYVEEETHIIESTQALTIDDNRTHLVVASTICEIAKVLQGVPAASTSFSLACVPDQKVHMGEEIKRSPVLDKNGKKEEITSSTYGQKNDAEHDGKCSGMVSEETMKQLVTSSHELEADTWHNYHLMDCANSTLNSLLSNNGEHGNSAWDCSQSEHFLKFLKLHCVEGQQHHDWHCTPQLLPKSNYDMYIHAAAYPGSKWRVIQNDELGRECIPVMHKDDSQHQRGMRRRLQLENPEARGKSLGASCNPWNPPKNASLTSPSPTPVDIDSGSLSHDGRNYIPVSKKQVSMLASPNPSFSMNRTQELNLDNMGKAGNSGNPSMPSGIGLHLNNIGNPVNATMQFTPHEYCASSGSVLFHSEGPNVDFPSNVVSSVTGNSKMAEHGFRAGRVVADNASLQSLPLDVKPLYSYLQYLKHSSNPHEIMISVPQGASGLGMELHISPQMKRRRATDVLENKDCKRCCHCKKSECLKLYCECFASGTFCGETCSCLECFNRPEYEEKCCEKRKSIVIRNPMAFDPKIVMRSTARPQSTGTLQETNDTSASARHKRGCNCKKSSCTKKYCECYQAKVGCSDGCRCDGCENTFGKKGGFVEVDIEDKNGGFKEPLEEKPEMVEYRNAHQLHPNVSTSTPFSQYSSHGRALPNSQYLARRHLSSQDHEIFDHPFFHGGPWVSPNGDKVIDMRTPTPLTYLSSQFSSSAGSSDNIKRSSGTQLRHCDGYLTQGLCQGVSSPDTPVPCVDKPRTNIGSSQLFEEGTIDMQKNADFPSKVVKATSPNQKHISSPHPRLQELGTLDSPSEPRSGRRYICHMGTPFPPLIPESKDEGSEK
ncbi:uncharacterized protein LOC18431707 isoform X1 [Amborella trichopoda]|uniref:uncharacterized protein LOC18431707 isoform X1 n=1 Tax=Amborella trichopoda TaxID=13333 RepID=UPI0009C156B2|nr:uncharacterized protein LOC18431707 isoform X1 [Amborella trichopoda]XP_020521370.1 uncharacterized protein LOC18431707 isoform X1 [Amborella trichopoda]XP_020521371.1 uncharacterized protein LOC18431707 isoform X1 [Amborella trichopoda]XP_020521372.1 uncharacterized protein LOC18431707 isoform X1 [Amborella trichopoda]XP_020521373.1 uncharacterized protein LOC18431707 isoform X1 [Amborella trichopoda]|eukprot:XP_020521369.1 uncharacterized protein LOC18431707 isoform X1 [Amborella trichopoda]